MATNKNFVVQNGLQVGPLTVFAGNGDIFTTGNISSTVQSLTFDSINNTPIGNAIPSTGTFTNLTTTNAAITNATISGNLYTNAVFTNGVQLLSASSGTGNLTISGNSVTLTPTGPGATTVGSSTSIPIITTDSYGRVVALSSAAVVTSLSTAGSSGTGAVNLANQTLTFNAGNGINTLATGNAISIVNTGVVSLTGTPHQVIVNSSTGFITVSLPQGIDVTSTPSFTGLNVNNTIAATSIYAATIGNIGATLTGTISTSTYSQPNITTLGGLTSFGASGATTTALGNLTINGNLNVQGNVNTINNTIVETTEYVSSIFASNVNAVTIGNIGANHVGTGTYLTSLNASNLSSGTVPSSVVSGSYSGITQLGTLTGLNIQSTGNISGAGNLNVGSAYVTAPIAGSTTSGALIVPNGGILVAGAIYAGALQNTPIGSVLASSGVFTSLNVTNTTAASSTTTGALQVSGGAGIAGSLYASGLYDGTNRAITSVTTNAGAGISLSSQTTTGPSASVTITNSGVLSITGTANQITANVSAGNILLSLPQSIATSSIPTFTGLNLIGGPTYGQLYAQAVYAMTLGNASSSIYGWVNTPSQPNITTMSGLTSFGPGAAIATITANGNLTVTGNLYVQGTTNTINNTIIENTEYVTNIYATNVRAVTVGNIGANMVGTGTYLTSLNGANLNSASVPNSALTNSSVTVSAGTGMSGGGTVSLGSSITLTNAGVTSLTSGGHITASASTGGITLGSDATSANTPSTIVARDSSGNFSGGTFTGTATQAEYADLAENYLADKQYAPGTVLMFGGANEVTLADPNTTRVAGIVSTNPAHLMNSALQGPTVAPLALIGRVPCQVIGPVAKGDLLVSAGFGYAKTNNTPTFGQVIGKALEDFVTPGKGVIEVVVGRL